MNTKQAYKKLNIKSGKEMNSLFLGNFKAAFHGKGIEFKDFREYTNLDDAKYIDWCTSSREWTTIMRRYREEKEGTILCVCDVTDSLSYEKESPKRELMQDIIELLAIASYGSGESFGGFIVWSQWAKYIVPKKSHSSLSVLSQLTQHTRDSRESLHLDFLLPAYLKRSIVFILSDSRKVDIASLSQAAAKHNLIYIHLSSHFENTLESEDDMIVWDASVSLGLSSKNTKKIWEYRELRKQELENFSKELQSIGVQSLFLDEKSSLFWEFLKFMKFREKRR